MTNTPTDTRGLLQSLIALKRCEMQSLQDRVAENTAYVRALQDVLDMMDGKIEVPR